MNYFVRKIQCWKDPLDSNASEDPGLNEKVARYIFGYFPRKHPAGGWFDEKRNVHEEIPKFASNMEDAFLVIQKMRELNVDVDLDADFEVVPPIWRIKIGSNEVVDTNLPKSVCNCAMLIFK